MLHKIIFHLFQDLALSKQLRILALDILDRVDPVDLIYQLLVLLLMSQIIYQGVDVILALPTIHPPLGLRSVDDIDNALREVFLRVGWLSKNGSQLVLVSYGVNSCRSS